jgi:riboflavin kinase/FMN adenylyltransferase
MTDGHGPLGLDQLPAVGPAIVTLGVFDGVHLGHRSALAATARAAADDGVASVAIVFEPHPVSVLQPEARVPRLAPFDINLERLRAAQLVDHVVPICFDQALSQLPALVFLNELAPAISVRGVAMAPDSAFGHARGGTPQAIAAAGRRVILVPPLEVDGQAVSSSRIRTAVAVGDVRQAAALGAPTYLRGRVVAGDRRGRELGFPTANLAFDYRPAMPALGIYLGRVAVPQRGVGPDHPALVSVGVRPTFHDDGRVLVEVYLLDYDGDLYDAELAVVLDDRLRAEQRFASVEALVAQMRADERQARHALGIG